MCDLIQSREIYKNIKKVNMNFNMYNLFKNYTCMQIYIFI